MLFRNVEASDIAVAVVWFPAASYHTELLNGTVGR